jgi:hypothetical protein
VHRPVPSKLHGLSNLGLIESSLVKLAQRLHPEPRQAS